MARVHVEHIAISRHHVVEAAQHGRTLGAGNWIVSGDTTRLAARNIRSGLSVSGDAAGDAPGFATSDVTVAQSLFE